MMYKHVKGRMLLSIINEATGHVMDGFACMIKLLEYKIYPSTLIAASKFWYITTPGSKRSS